MAKTTHSSYSFRKYCPWAVETLKRDNYKCVECGSDNSIIVHHIDESRKNGIKKMNNNLDNLQTLCRFCHADAHKTTMRYVHPGNSLIVEMRQQGKKIGFIADHLGITRQRVSQIMHKDKRYTPELSKRIVTTLNFKCDQCKKLFSRILGKGGRIGQKHYFCSRKCFGQWKSKNVRPWNKK